MTTTIPAAEPTRTLRRAVALTMAARGVQIVAGFAGTVATARYLGPTVRGEYFLVVTAATVAVQFANVGLPASNTYLVARNPRLFPALVANTLWASVGIGLVTASIALLALRGTNLFGDEPLGLFWFVLPLVPAMLTFMLGTNLLVGTHRMFAFNVFEMVGNLMVVCALVTAGVVGAGVTWFLVASAGSWTLTSFALTLYLVRVSGSGLRPRFDIFTGGLRYATKAYVLALLGYLVLRLNVFVLHHYYGSVELGYYSVAAQVADVIAVFPGSVALVLFPRLVGATRDRRRATLRSLTFVGIGLALACGTAAVLASTFMRVAFGPAFVPAGAVLRLLLPGAFAVGLTTILSQYFGAVGLPLRLLGIWALGLVTVAVAGLALIPNHGGAGAAAALSAAYGVILVLTGVGFLRHRGAPDPRGDDEPGLRSEALDPPPA